MSASIATIVPVTYEDFGNGEDGKGRLWIRAIGTGADKSLRLCLAGDTGRNPVITIIVNPAQLEAFYNAVRRYIRTGEE